MIRAKKKKKKIKAEKGHRNVFCEDFTEKVIVSKELQMKEELATPREGDHITNQRKSKCPGPETGASPANLRKYRSRFDWRE